MTQTVSTKRDIAIRQGLAFIYQSAGEPASFESYGSDLLCCFYCISTTSSDADLRRLARSLGRKLARRWWQQHTEVPLNADASDVADLVFGSDAAERLGVGNRAFKQQLRKSAGAFGVRDYLFFDPATERPPADVPFECSCGAPNPRGRKVCRQCRTPLSMMSPYWVWLNALTIAYTGERHGVRLGASFADVLKWLPAMRPYPSFQSQVVGSDYYWAICAVTHVVYTLNNYSAYRLSPAWLPDEFAFLKENLTRVIEMKDAETLGEILDSLKSFGLSEKHPLMRRGLRYLLSCQNDDGSWGDVQAEDAYERYHSTRTAIDGLRDYAWRGERLSLEKLPPFLALNEKSGP